MKGRSPGDDWNLERMPNKSCAQTSTGEGEEDPPNEAIDKSKTISESDDEKERSKNICQRNLILLFFSPSS